LTYNSIFDEIAALVREGRLFMVQPGDRIRAPRVALAERRKLYVSPQIDQFLKSDRSLAPETEADFDEIILGERFDVALQLDHQFCRMARLVEPSEEVWEIRIYDTKPQIRFFGRFAGRNVFVALIGPVGRVKSTLNWNRLKRQSIAAWERMFTHPPVRNGDDINAYLSNVDLV
jgi:hypothetical protein